MALDEAVLEQLLHTIRRFVTERLVPHEHALENEDRVPEEIVDEMRELGLFGMAIPTEYGGLDLTTEEEILVGFELGHTAPAFRTLIAINNGIGSQAILISGTDEQKKKYLTGLASGELIGAFALTEPESGSDAASLRTRAERTADGWVLNGTKRFITNAPEADVFTVMARTGSQDSGADGVSAFVVERNAPGLVIGPPDKKMGQRGAHTSDVIFEDCQIPADALIGKEGDGFRTAMKVLDRGRLGMAATAVGVAERLIKDSLEYAKTRKQFHRPISDFQLVQAMLADSRTEAYAARCMVLETARRKDRGEKVTTEVSCSKYFATEMVGRVADRAVQIHGGAGYIADYGVERFYRDVRLMRLYEGTSQIQQLIIAKNMIKDGYDY